MAKGSGNSAPPGPGECQIPSHPLGHIGLMILDHVQWSLPTLGPTAHEMTPAAAGQAKTIQL